MAPPKIAICSTNYNCAHALDAHLRSIYKAFQGLDFEYAVVDNHSRDASWSILRSWSERHDNLRMRSVRCTRGKGRNLAVALTTAPVLVVVDTDVIYRRDVSDFVLRCADVFPHLGVQAIFLGVFSRALWHSVGGFRSFNTYEDVDLWLRLHASGRMRWYPVAMGENQKEINTVGGYDHLSHRYTKSERMSRLVRREWDLFQTRRYEGLDLPGLVRSNSLDTSGAAPASAWVSFRPRLSVGEHIRVFGRYFFQILRS